MRVWYTEITISYETREGLILHAIDRHLSRTEDKAKKYVYNFLKSLNSPRKLQEILGDLWEDGDTFIGTEYCDFMIQSIEVE